MFAAIAVLGWYLTVLLLLPVMIPPKVQTAPAYNLAAFLLLLPTVGSKSFDPDLK